MSKTFSIGETKQLQIRADATNSELDRRFAGTYVRDVVIDPVMPGTQPADLVEAVQLTQWNLFDGVLLSTPRVDDPASTKSFAASANCSGRLPIS